MNEPRPLQHLRDWGARYPRAWTRLEEFRAKRGSIGFGTWPDWCYVPIAGSYAVVSEAWGERALSPGVAADIAVIAALGAWRMTRGVYRVDPTLLTELYATRLDREIPVEVLYHLPQWCLYVEMDAKVPALSHLGDVRGFYAQMEFDANTADPELRLLIDTDEA
ncbi:MAG: AcrVA2 family anti-CRISPR protein, partial [Blastocatellia bacterium]